MNSKKGDEVKWCFENSILLYYLHKEKQNRSFCNHIYENIVQTQPNFDRLCLVKVNNNTICEYKKTCMTLKVQAIIIGEYI